MTISSVNPESFDDDPSTPKLVPYKYDLRLEIGAKKDSGPVPVVAIFSDLVRRLKAAADDGAPVAVLTATDKLFIEHKEMTSDEFQKAFHVDNTEGKASKVLLGFKIQSLTKLSELKRRLMHTFLIPHNIFLRQHVGGFENGVKLYSYGFLKDDHPDHPDISMLNQRFGRVISDSWKKLNKDDRSKWRKDLPAAFFGNTGIILPINFTKERLSATHGEKGKIITQALTISTPTKYGKLMKLLLDTALAGKKLNNLIPFALGRDNPEGYYYVVAQQARFIENHRNIPIMNVPADANIQKGSKGEILSGVLNGNPAIHRIAYDTQQNKYHVSTTAAKYKEVHQWIHTALLEHSFPYSPQVRPLKYHSPTGNGTAFSYSDILKDTISLASDSYATSTIKTTPSTAWKSTPPIAISYDINDTAFPKLSSTKTRDAVTPPTTSAASDEETFQSAISTAIKKLEDQHREELKKLKQEMQKQIDEVTTKMKDLGEQVAVQTYQALVRAESPLVTKHDHAILQHEISTISTQLSMIIKLFEQGTNKPTSPNEDTTCGSPPRTSKRSKPSSTPTKLQTQDSDYTQDQSISSASFDPDEGLERCEE